MKRYRMVCWGVSLATGFMVMAPLLIVCAGLQPISVPFPSAPPPAGGGGDSGVPIFSADGRYILFASTANNLAMLGNGNAMPAPMTPCANVFVRDRLNDKTVLITQNYAGTGGGNADSFPAGISTNGQFVLFESQASNLVVNDTNGVNDVFVRDTVNNTTTLVSISSLGGSANGESHGSVMAPDGQHVAFVSSATNLVAGDANQIPDVFMRNLQTGTTLLVSVGAQSGTAGGSDAPAISANDRYVAFSSMATNLVSGATNPGEIYVRDLSLGITYWASTNALSSIQLLMDPTVTRAFSYDPQISSNGQFVAFAAKAANSTYPPIKGLILRYRLPTRLLGAFTDIVCSNTPGASAGLELDSQSLTITPDGRFVAFVANTTNSATCIYQWDASNPPSILASVNLSNGTSAGTTASFPVQTPDGRFVAFYCTDHNLTASIPPANASLYVRDTQAGTTVFADHAPGTGLGVNPSGPATLSSDGRYIAFERMNGNLVPNDNTQDRDVFVTDLTQTATELVSAHDPALPSLTANGSSWLFGSSVSTNGRFVAFVSDAADLVPKDTNGYRDVFVHDFLSGTNILASAGTNGAAANGISTEPSISADGRFVAFTSYATNLVARDTNNARDVFLRDLQSGATTLVSISTTGGVGNTDSYSPTVSGDGRYVLFFSPATNLAAGPFSSSVNSFLRDRIAGQTFALTKSGTMSASMTSDGHFVAFVGTLVSGSGTHLYLWNSQLAKRTYTNNTASLTAVSVSSDGQSLAYLTSSPLRLSVINLSSNVTKSVSTGPFPVKPGLTLSSDGHFLTYIAATNIYLYDYQAGTSLLVSQNSSGGIPNGASDSPSISPDGRFVAYRSYASNIVTNDFNGVSDIFLFDRVNNTTTLLSADAAGNFPAINRSLTPVFSGDGLTLVFQSSAPDLVTNDFNNSSDILAYDLIAIPGTGLGGFGATNSIPPFSVQMNLTGGSAQTPVPLLSWPLVSGQSYQAQYQDHVGDTAWQNVNGGIIFIGNTGYINDLSPSGNQRFYRIVLNNN